MLSRMKLALGAAAVVGGLALCASPAQAQRVPLAPLLQKQQAPWRQAQPQALDRQRYPQEVESQRYHDELEYREFRRDLEHREVHRYPMTWREHERLHDRLEDEAYRDELEHRQFHRGQRYRDYRLAPS